MRASAFGPTLVFSIWLAGALASPPAASAQNAGPPAPSESPQAPPAVEEEVVVTASRAREELLNAPAAVTVIGSHAIEAAPSLGVGDLLRAVPGVNVAQLSTRDVNITTRRASSALATSQLVLVDGRSIYLDFFGMVMWDLIPVVPADIRQIEVVRGPASAVWGANALGGVINVITRTPREAAAAGPATTATFSAGGFGRRVGEGSEGIGSIFSTFVTHSQVVNDRWSYRVSAGYKTQDPLPRPTGTLPSGVPYPAFANSSTHQPSAMGRADYELRGGGHLIFEGGAASTSGIIYTGIGPADIERGSRLGYMDARYENGPRRVAVFTNLLHGQAATLLAVGPDRQPIPLNFDTTTLDVEAGDARVIGGRHAVSYGGNFRHNAFDVSLTPRAGDRHEAGGYLQDELFLAPWMRWMIGARVDAFSSLDKPVFSPRTALLIKPSPAQTFRVSYNRAFRTPSLVNNHLDITIVTPVTLPGVGLFTFPTQAVGDPTLKRETVNAYEVGYSSVLRTRATVNAAVYWTRTDDVVRFVPVATYSPANPPPGWPLPTAFVPSGTLPARYTYANLGHVDDKGIEAGVEIAVTRALSAFANYSYQSKPLVRFQAPFTVADVNWPARNRFNTGASVEAGRLLGALSVNWVDSAYWQDVLDRRFAGTTEAYTLINASIGWRWRGPRLVTTLRMTNLANQSVMQHIFGDVLKRQVVAEVRVGL